MTSVYVTSIQSVDAKRLMEILPFLDTRVREKISRLKRKEDQVRSVAAHALMLMKIAEQVNMRIEDIHYTVNEYGKYGLAGNHLYFNLTHAGDYVACAISHRPVGIDLEEKRQRDFNLFMSVWSEQEKNQYDLCNLDSFYRLWTAKESYIKYLGIGLHARMNELTILPYGAVIVSERIVKASIKNIPVHKDYTCAVCCEDKVEHIDVIEVDAIRTFYKRID